MDTKKTEILSLLPEEIAEFLPKEPPFRAVQIFEWLHERRVKSFEKMSNLPKALRAHLDSVFYIPQAEVIERHVSKDNDTEKFLLKFNDAYVESVKLLYKHGNSVCISTQAGCKMGCTFCASASGFQRNLTAGEYCAQVYSAGNISNIVLMGCGEPLDNFSNTFRFIELITHIKGARIGERRITISTCGLVPKILRLMEHRLQVTLAVSLHAPTDEIRRQLMPIAKKYPLKELIAACHHYTNITRRRITFEYALVNNVNDSPAQARELAKLLQGMLCHVNLIPVNEASQSGLSPTPLKGVQIFADILGKNGITATVRRSLGADINAACGQLRANY